MNLHKAKGLEADVVFLADPTGGMKQRVDVHIKRDGAKALGWFKVEKKSEGSFAAKLLGQHADWDEHKAAEEPYLSAEETRLLYVAATRAREMLVVSRWTGQKGTPAWGVINGALGAAKELPVPATVKVASPKPESCSTMAQIAALQAREAADSRVNAPSWSITSVTAEVKHIAKMAVAVDSAAADDATRVVAEGTPSHRADAGMAWGTLIHGLLEHAMRHQGAGRDDLLRLARWLTVEQPQLRPVVDEAVDVVERVRTAAFWQQASASEHAAEVPFTIADGDYRLLAGVIDLLFLEGKEWTVLDYKTDVSSVAALSEAYRRQLQAYERALALCGLPVGAARIAPIREAHQRSGA